MATKKKTLKKVVSVVLEPLEWTVTHFNCPYCKKRVHLKVNLIARKCEYYDK